MLWLVDALVEGEAKTGVYWASLKLLARLGIRRRTEEDQ
jgi:hypothetical protein